MQPRDPSCQAPPPFFVRVLIPILKDLMLHEIAVAWLTARLKVTVPAKPWEESPELFGARLKQAAEYVNLHYDVDALQRGLPARVQMLLACEGGRIGK